MLYLFSGDDTKNKTLSYEKFMESLTAQAGMPGGTETFFINRNDFDPVQIESFYSGASLFSASCAVLFQNVFELPKEKPEKFNTFLLANAFGEKDKLNLWIYFRQALSRGVSLEEIVGVLFWKIKDLLLRKNFSKFSEGQLKAFASKISYLLPEARKKGLDAESALEQFLLEAF